MNKHIDFAGLMQLGLCHLRLLPDQFWALTPVELILMAGGVPGQSTSMTRDKLNALCAEFPDNS